MTTKTKKKPNGYWNNEDNIREESKKYNTKNDFRKSCSHGYKAALRLGIIDELFENQHRSWNEDSLIEESKKYSTKYEFQKGSSGAYNACRKNFPGLIDELFSNGNIVWDEKSVRQQAAKCSSKYEFSKKCRKAYRAAHKLGLIDDLFKNRYKSWDEISIRQEAAGYGTKKDFKESSVSAYQAALRLGIIDKLFENQYRYWDEDSIRKEASEYSTRKEFQKGCVGAYNAAHRLGIIDDLGLEDDDKGWWSKDNFHLYTIRIDYDNGSMLKVGISSEPDERFNSIKSGSTLNIIPIDLLLIGTGKEAYEFEQSIHNKINDYHINSEVAKARGVQSGHTECFEMTAYDKVLESINEYNIRPTDL